VVLLMPDGGRLALHADVQTTCAVWIAAQWYRARFDITVSPMHVLQASIQAPELAPAGRPDEYVVTLANPTDTAIALDPCPNYQQFVMSVKTSGGNYGLNCPTSPIPAHGSVRFAMVMSIPTDAPIGATQLYWSLTGGARATRLVEMTVPITITS
jgi:hypothetical protein